MFLEVLAERREEPFSELVRHSPDEEIAPDCASPEYLRSFHVDTVYDQAAPYGVNVGAGEIVPGVRAHRVQAAVGFGDGSLSPSEMGFAIEVKSEIVRLASANTSAFTGASALKGICEEFRKLNQCVRSGA